MPKLDTFKSLASNSTGVIRVARGADGQPGTEMHVSGGAVRGSLRSPKAFAGSLVSKVAEFFRQIGEAFSRTYSQERAQRAHQAYDAFRGALYEAVGEGRAASILARVVKDTGQITPAEVKRAIQEVDLAMQEAEWIKAVNSMVPVQMDKRALSMQALLTTDPHAKPAVIAQHMFEMAASRGQGFDQTLVALEDTIQAALKDRSHQHLRNGMTPEQARSAALAEARRFFEGQLLKPGSASWAVLQSWTVGAERINGNFMRCVDLVLAMSNVMKRELPEIYAEDLRLNFDDMLVPKKSEVDALGEQSEVYADGDISQDAPNEEPASLVSTEKRWWKEQSVLHQLHTYLHTVGGKSKSATAQEAMAWVVESPFYKAPLDRGVLSLSGLPASTRKGLQDSHGVLTKDLVNWLVQSGHLTPQLDPQKDRIEVEVMERSGAGTLALMMVKVNGQNAFVIKECGNTFEGDDSKPHYFGYHLGPDGHWVGQAFEDEKLGLVQGSALARHSEIAVPGGGQFKLAMAAATFRSRPDFKCTTVDPVGRSHRERVEHQVNLLPAAQGKGLGEVLEGDNQETARKAAADMGAALAAFHRTHLISEAPLTTGGLRTLVHGDFHPGNLFYDDQSRTVTAIDLAGAAFNFIDRVETEGSEPAQFAPRDPAGHDMLVDVKRAVEQGTHFRHEAHGAALKQAFLQAYSDAFKDILGPDGQPRYTVESLSELIKQENLGLALT